MLVRLPFDVEGDSGLYGTLWVNPEEIACVSRAFDCVVMLLKSGQIAVSRKPKLATGLIEGSPDDKTLDKWAEDTIALCNGTSKRKVGDRVIVIRDASPAERAKLRALWVKDMRPDGSAPDGPWGKMLPAPTRGHQIAPSLWRMAAQAAVDRALAEAKVQVADLASVPGEPVAWIAWEHGEGVVRLHFIHVFGPARRRGIATTMVREATAGCAPVTATYLTPDGAKLLQHVSRLCEPTQPTTAISGPTDHEGSCSPNIGGMQTEA